MNRIAWIAQRCKEPRESFIPRLDELIFARLRAKTKVLRSNGTAVSGVCGKGKVSGTKSLISCSTSCYH